jgi:hypothetical protein
VISDQQFYQYIRGLLTTSYIFAFVLEPWICTKFQHKKEDKGLDVLNDYACDLVVFSKQKTSIIASANLSFSYFSKNTRIVSVRDDCVMDKGLV